MDKSWDDQVYGGLHSPCRFKVETGIKNPKISKISRMSGNVPGALGVGWRQLGVGQGGRAGSVRVRVCADARV
eukprot:scaffold327834_cov57-Tisochrysis_lutea.AAC.1